MLCFGIFWCQMKLKKYCFLWNGLSNMVPNEVKNVIFYWNCLFYAGKDGLKLFLSTVVVDLIKFQNWPYIIWCYACWFDLFFFVLAKLNVYVFWLVLIKISYFVIWSLVLSSALISKCIIICSSKDISWCFVFLSECCLFMSFHKCVTRVISVCWCCVVSTRKVFVLSLKKSNCE